VQADARASLQASSEPSFPTFSCATEGEPGRSILGTNMPIEEEEPECDPSKQATVENSPLAHAVRLSDLR